MAAGDRMEDGNAAQQDAALVDALDACDQYLDDHERVAKLLKQVRAVGLAVATLKTRLVCS